MTGGGAEAAAASPLSAASPPPITTSWRVPVEPSIMVTVFCSPACFGASLASCLLSGLLSWPRLAAAGFSSVALGSRIAIRVIGSPPSGSLLKMAKPAKATRNRPSMTVRACMAVNGSRSRRFRRGLSCPSGALRSSAVSVMRDPESLPPTIPRRGQAASGRDRPGVAGAPSKKGGSRSRPFREMR
ncbi:hypothetical protein ACVWZ3_009024 [Bradyrhizobium sp. i1.3.6]